MSLKFNPVQCTSEQFSTMSAQEGYVYFVTDIKKIYLGKDNTMIPMAVSSGIFYGIKDIDWDDDGLAKPTEVIFYESDIENTGEGYPEQHDLILNKDGCFYRVMDVIGDEYTTQRMTLRGSGGSGGGSGDGGGNITPSGGSFGIVVNKNFYYASIDSEVALPFTINYAGTDSNYISKIEFKLLDLTATEESKKEIEFYTMDKDKNNQTLVFNKQYNAFLYNFKHLFKDVQYIQMYVYDAYDNVKSAKIKLNRVTLELGQEAEDLLVARSNKLDYTCKVISSSDTGSREIVYSFYTEDNLYKPIYSETLKDVGVSNVSTPLDVNSLAHGIYILQVQASASVSGSGKKIPSNILTHKVAVFSQSSTEPLLMVKLPEMLEQYTNLPMKYQVLTNESNESYTLDIQVNKKTKVRQSVLSNQSGTYDLYFEKAGTYTLDVSVIELNLSYSMPIVIKSYSGKIPVINADHQYLMLYLNPRDKSNSAVDRNIWADYRGDILNNLENLTGSLEGFHYGEADGWMQDKQGIPYLQLSSGAALSLDKFSPFATDLSLNLGLTIELDFEINGVTDFSAPLIQCISKTGSNINVGFTVTGDRITFNGSTSDGISLNLVEGKRIRVSFVVEKNPQKNDQYPMMYGYLNGKIAGAKLYKTATFKESPHNKAILQANSDNAQIKIYGIRFYSIALDSQTILNNYTASLPSLTEREASYLSNNMVYDGLGNISYDKVSSPDYNLEIPYMVLTGGYATEEKNKWTLRDRNNRGGPALPVGKKDYRLVDVKVVYPQSFIDDGHHNYEFINKFTNDRPIKDVYGESPINGGAIMYCQGTSSMEYPVKNLRLRFKNAENWYSVEPDLDNVEIICMKADYMESSGSHNTGAANMIDDLYNSMDMKTPGQAHFGPQAENDGRKRIVTAIKGHPCLIFYSPTGESGSYEYIGKYNLNLDKATPEPFGFNHDDSTFGYLTNEQGELVLDANGEKQNSIFCFEFLDNAIEVCNFINKAKKYDDDGNADESAGRYTYYETWYNEFVKEDEKVPGWALGFESRYPEDKVGKNDADALYDLASWINKLHYYENQDTALIEFKNNYWKYLDKDFTLVYYLFTEALLMADSRVKNMMIATWGKEHRYYNAETGEVRKTAPENMSGWQHHFGYIFYPIFYDMDTMLGLDNTGKYRFQYYDEDYSDVYNGANILWNYVRDAFENETTKKSYYDKMENAALTIDRTGEKGILKYFNTNQANVANEAFYNGDAEYKYIRPAIEGYDDLLHEEHIAPGVGPYLYAAQGDRSLMREWFATNRLSFLRGKYTSRLFREGDRITYRQYFPDKDNLPKLFEGHEATLTAVPPSGDFTFSSAKTGYAGILLGANGGLDSERFDGRETKTISVSNMGLANGTEAYIVGLSNLVDLGDMSDKYMQKLIIGSDNVRLERLILGNPHKDYYNPYWGTTVVTNGVNDSPTIDVSKAIYLQEFNLQNCLSYGTSLDFTNCKAIEKIMLTGSGVNSIIFPAGGIMQEVRLPVSVTSIKINSCGTLTPEKFSIGGYDYDATFSVNGQTYGSVDTIQDDEKQNRRYLNDYSNINSIEVIDTNIDTYSMVCGANVLGSYCLRGINWEITSQNSQYCLRNDKENLTPDQIKNSYIYDGDNKRYVLWQQETYPTDGRALYEKVDMVNGQGEMVNIPVLEKLRMLQAINNKPSEDLTGKITINIANMKVNELAIYEKYINIYPNVEIIFDNAMGNNVTRAYRVKFYRAMYEEGIDISNMEPYFVRLTDGTKTLAQIIDSNEFTNPTKSPTANKTFTFTGNWVDALDTNKTVYSQSGNFNTAKPNSDMSLVPQFITDERLYTIHFFEHDNTELSDLIISNATYLTTVQNCFTNEQIPLSQYRYRSGQGLSDNQRWAFKGWISEVDYNMLQNNNSYKPEVQNLATLQVVSDLKLYAYYNIESITTASDENLFQLATERRTINGLPIDGCVIDLKPMFAQLVRGKITIPATFGGVNVIALGSLNAASNLNELYFASNNITYLADASCRDCYSLTKVQLPTSLVEIGQQAFYQDSALKTINLLDINVTALGQDAFASNTALELSRLPDTLTHIGVRAFHECKNITISDIPQSVTVIGEQCFMGCSKVNVSELGKGQPLQVGYRAFAYTGKSASTTESIKINSPVIFTKDGNNVMGIFFESFTSNLKDLYTYSSFGYDGNDSALVADLFGSQADGITVHILK